MNDKIKINLQMAGSSYPRTIPREEEEVAREAAKQVNICINLYRREAEMHGEELTQERALAMTAYHFALKLLEEKQRNETQPYTEKIEELTKELEDYFKKL